MKHIVIYHPIDSDTAYIRNDWTDPENHCLDFVDNINDAFVFETDRQLEWNSSLEWENSENNKIYCSICFIIPEMVNALMLL